MPEFSYVFSTLLSLTPVTPVVPDKSGFAMLSVGFLTISFFTIVWACLWYASLAVLFVNSPSPTLAVTVTLLSTLSAGTSMTPSLT